MAAARVSARRYLSCQCERDKEVPDVTNVYGCRTGTGRRIFSSWADPGPRGLPASTLGPDDHHSTPEPGREGPRGMDHPKSRHHR